MANTDDRSPGKIGRAQLASTFGAGSIYELRTHRSGHSVLHSVTILGLDWWTPRLLETIREPILQKALKRKYFKLPPSEDDSGSSAFAPAVRFPRWLVCNGCERLGIIGKEFDDLGSGGPRCNAVDCRGRAVPARFVVVCYRSKTSKDPDRQPGHIDDFPWIWWAHSVAGEICKKPQLKLETERNTTALSGLIVRCYSEECAGKTERSLEGVFGGGALEGMPCSGRRPWLDDRESGCDRPTRVLLRGASNTYFPVTASAISIPPFSSNLSIVIERHCDALIPSVGKIDIGTLISAVRNAVPEIKEKYSDPQIQQALERLAGVATDRIAVSERQQRTLERKALLEGRTEEEEPGSEFVAIPQRKEILTLALKESFEAVVRVKRLREVRVLRGFHRVSSLTGGDLYSIECAPISRIGKDWLPAIEVRGEGIYFELDHERVTAWENKGVQRAEIIRARCRDKWNDDGIEFSEADLPTARLLLVHTLSHLIMKQVSLQCGYSSASLREKLYVGIDEHGEDELGALIYTATTGSDGTLGGLERQGKSERFEVTVSLALEGARWCSSDPLCIESRGQGTDALNLSACHACCLISETSCELHNQFLDRGLLFGTPADTSIGFFSTSA